MYTLSLELVKIQNQNFCHYDYRMSFRFLTKQLRSRIRARISPFSSIFLRSFSQFSRFLLNLFLCESNLSVVTWLREETTVSVVIYVLFLQTYVWHCIRHWWCASPWRCSHWRLSTSSQKVIWRFSFFFCSSTTLKCLFFSSWSLLMSYLCFFLGKCIKDSFYLLDKW